jgi:hypothetical protein
VNEGAIAYRPGTGAGMLSTTTEFPDYQLRADFRSDDQANSGVFLRCPAQGEISATNSYEVNIYDPHPKWPTGSINEIARTKGQPKTAGKWNTYDITADGDHLVVRLNGETTVDARDGKFARGTIALQQFDGKGEVRFQWQGPGGLERNPGPEVGLLRDPRRMVECQERQRGSAIGG